MKIQKEYILKNEDELILTGKQLREFKEKVIEGYKKEKKSNYKDIILIYVGILALYLYGLMIGTTLTKIEALSVFFITSIGVLLVLIITIINKTPKCNDIWEIEE